MTIEHVYHPNHYTYGKYEAIDVIKDWVKEDDGFTGFCKGNVLKYLCREKHKGGLEDIMKAEYYLDMIIEYKSEYNNTK